MGGGSSAPMSRTNTNSTRTADNSLYIETAKSDSNSDTARNDHSSPSRISSPIKNARASTPSQDSPDKLEPVKQRTPSFFSMRPSSGNLYLTKEEEQEIKNRLKIRNASIQYAYEYIYYGVPVKTKGMNKPGGGSPSKEVEKDVMHNDPDLTVMSIDGAMVLKQRVEASGMGGKEAHRQSIDLGVEFASYPESVTVDRYGDIFVSMKNTQMGKRLIDGVALLNLKYTPNPPDPPFIVGTTSTTVTVGWNGTDEGTGIIDRYQLEYKELNEHNSGYRALATINWARDDDLLFSLENVKPNNSFLFRVRCRNRLGWSEMSGDSNVATTDASHPDTPDRCFATKITPDSIHLHWHPPNNNGSNITKYIVRGKRVGGIFLTVYEGAMTSYMVCDVEAGCNYVFEVKAMNACGKSGWSSSRTCKVPMIAEKVEINSLEMNPDLRKGHLWIECWDPKDERVFYFHTITNRRALVAPEEYSAWRNEKEEKRRTNFRNGGGGGGGGGGGSGDSNSGTIDPVKVFRMKRYHFFQSVRKRNGRDDGLLHTLTIRRSNLFTDTFSKFANYHKSDFVKKFKLVFQGEEGIDSGGLTKDWYLALSRAMGVSKLKIFSPCSSGGYEIHPSSGASETQLAKFRFAGMVLGKALFDRQFLDMPLSKTMYKLILDKDVGINDLEEIDKALYKSLAWMGENSIDGILFETFSVEVEEDVILEGGNPSAKKTRVALCEDGENKDVNDENKREYIRLMAEWRVKWSVITQLEAFMEGLNVLVPNDLLREFSVNELELLFNGKKHIDTDEIRAYTIYQGDIKPDSKICTWFWQVLREVSVEKKMKLLKFITGSDRVPLDGFNPPFNITFGSDMEGGDLPRAHTCFNQIVLPNYKSYNVMREKCIYAAENCEEFVLT